MKIQKTAGCMLQEQMDASSSPARPPPARPSSLYCNCTICTRKPNLKKNFIFRKNSISKLYYRTNMFDIEEKFTISKKNLRYRSIFNPKKTVFLNKDSFQSALFCFVFVLLFKAQQRFAYILLLQRYFKLLNVLLCFFLFKAKQRFAHLLLILVLILFLNVLFSFRSVFQLFKRFRFVSISKQFDIEALLSKNLYYR